MAKFFWIILLIAFSRLCYSTNSETDIKNLVNELQEHIEDISNAIELTDGINQLDILGLYNERGTAYFFIGEFESALKDFNHVLANLKYKEVLNRKTLGAALWGRMLCHAFKGQIEETQADVDLIAFLFIESNECNFQRKREFFQATNSSNQFIVIPTAKFANPNEKISPQECQSRVSHTANLMRTIALKISNSSARLLVEYIIDQLADTAFYCCQDAPEWTQCLGPIIDAWHNLQDSWDKLSAMVERGVRIAPYLVGPGR